jgi:hypothetical protein
MDLEALELCCPVVHIRPCVFYMCECTCDLGGRPRRRRIGSPFSS